MNRRRALFDEALALAERGCTVDLTAFPVAEGEDAWSAEEALVRYLDAGLPSDRVTVSSDGGGCLPVFDAEGRVASMDVGSPSARGRHARDAAPLRPAARAGAAGVHANPARLLRLERKGRLGRAPTPTWWCSTRMARSRT